MSLNTASNYEVTSNVICRCRARAIIRTSWTRANPGRRFFSCPNYTRECDGCNYFEWYDVESGEREKKIFNRLQKTVERLEAAKKETTIKWRICLCIVNIFWLLVVFAMLKFGGK